MCLLHSFQKIPRFSNNSLVKSRNNLKMRLKMKTIFHLFLYNLYAGLRKPFFKDNGAYIKVIGEGESLNSPGKFEFSCVVTV